FLSRRVDDVTPFLSFGLDEFPADQQRDAWDVAHSNLLGRFCENGTHCLSSGQVEADRGWKASWAGIVATSLDRSHSPLDSSGVLTSYRYISWITRPSARMEALCMMGSWMGISRIFAAT